MQERTTITVSEKVMAKARTLAEKEGVPISRQFQLAWVEKYD